MGSVCRCRCLLSGWATLLLSCSFKWGKGDETQPGSCWRGIIPSGAEFKRWKSEFEGWGHLFIHDGIEQSAEIGLNQREILRWTVQAHMIPECCWSTFLLLKHRNHMHHKETCRRSEERSTHQRSEWQQQQRSPNTWSLHYPASHPPLFSSFLILCTAHRSRLFLVLVLLSAAGSSCWTWKVLPRQKGREGPSQTHPGVWALNLFSGVIPAGVWRLRSKPERKEKKRGRNGGERKENEWREIRGREADKCLWEDTVF